MAGAGGNIIVTNSTEYYDPSDVKRDSSDSSDVYSDTSSDDSQGHPITPPGKTSHSFCDPDLQQKYDDDPIKDLTLYKLIDEVLLLKKFSSPYIPTQNKIDNLLKKIDNTDIHKNDVVAIKLLLDDIKKFIIINNCIVTDIPKLPPPLPSNPPNFCNDEITNLYAADCNTNKIETENNLANYKLFDEIYTVLKNANDKKNAVTTNAAISYYHEIINDLQRLYINNIKNIKNESVTRVYRMGFNDFKNENGIVVDSSDKCKTKFTISDTSSVSEESSEDSSSPDEDDPKYCSKFFIDASNKSLIEGHDDDDLKALDFIYSIVEYINQITLSLGLLSYIDAIDLLNLFVYENTANNEVKNIYDKYNDTSNFDDRIQNANLIDDMEKLKKSFKINHCIPEPNIICWRPLYRSLYYQSDPLDFKFIIYNYMFYIHWLSNSDITTFNIDNYKKYTLQQLIDEMKRNIDRKYCTNVTIDDKCVKTLFIAIFIDCKKFTEEIDRFLNVGRKMNILPLVDLNSKEFCRDHEWIIKEIILSIRSTIENLSEKNIISTSPRTTGSQFINVINTKFIEHCQEYDKQVKRTKKIEENFRLSYIRNHFLNLYKISVSDHPFDVKIHIKNCIKTYMDLYDIFTTFDNYWNNNGLSKPDLSTEEHDLINSNIDLNISKEILFIQTIIESNISINKNTYDIVKDIFITESALNKRQMLIPTAISIIQQNPEHFLLDDIITYLKNEKIYVDTQYNKSTASGAIFESNIEKGTIIRDRIKKTQQDDIDRLIQKINRDPLVVKGEIDRLLNNSSTSFGKKQTKHLQSKYLKDDTLKYLNSCSFCRQ